jgi:hypothetical protein
MDKPTFFQYYAHREERSDAANPPTPPFRKGGKLYAPFSKSGKLYSSKGGKLYPILFSQKGAIYENIDDGEDFASSINLNNVLSILLSYFFN